MKQLLAAFLLATFSLLAQAQNRGLPDFTELVEKQGPAVVNISTTQTARSSGRGGQPFPFDENDPMNEFFRRFIPRQPGMPGFPGAPRDFESPLSRLGVRGQCRRLYSHQCARCRFGRRNPRSSDRQA
jgi:serine protease Do